MKQTQASMPATKQAESRGQLIGLGILSIIIVFVAVWLQIQDKGAVSQSSATFKPIADKDLARFLADAWYLPNEPLLGFVEIPAGPFVMASDPNTDPMAFANEKWSAASNQGTVTIPAFYIGRYEVTVAEFRSFVATTGFKADQSLQGVPDHPVVNVSWSDALAYARWLEAQLKQSPQTPAALSQLLNDGWRITLPNEAQWEKAARGVDARIYPWGNAPAREHANFRSASTTPVGSFSCPNCAFNLADMSGNVWELTRSPYQPYPFDAKSTPNLQAEALFVMRGGSFNDAENTIRAAVRGGIDPGARRPFIGFRIVLSRD